MNDIEFIETLKQKRNACDYSQSRLAQELQIILQEPIYCVYCNLCCQLNRKTIYSS